MVRVQLVNEEKKCGQLFNFSITALSITGSESGEEKTFSTDKRFHSTKTRQQCCQIEKYEK